MNDKKKNLIIWMVCIAVIVIMIVAIIMMFNQALDNGLYITFEKS